MKATYRKSGDNYLSVILHSDGRRETTEGPALANIQTALKYARLEIHDRMHKAMLDSRKKED